MDIMTDKRELHDKALGKVSGGNIFNDIVDVAEDAVDVVTEPVKEVYDTVTKQYKSTVDFYIAVPDIKTLKIKIIKYSPDLYKKKAMS